MTPPPACVDRRTGTPRHDRVYAPRFFDWCYNTGLGRRVMDLVLTQHLVAAAFHLYGRLPCSTTRLAQFCSATGIDMSEARQPLESFRCLNDLITRDIDLRLRPVDPREDTCTAPVDGRYLVYPSIRIGQPFRIKALTFDLSSFLRDDSLAACYDGGALVVARLGLSDYHHFHFPVAGVPGPVRRINGRFHAVSPYSRDCSVPVFAQNVRAVTLIASGLFGRVAMVEVGAFSVGTIREVFTPGIPVVKGDRKGHFEIGGSLIGLIFLPDTVQLASDLIDNSRRAIETYVRLGEPVGLARTP